MQGKIIHYSPAEQSGIIGGSDGLHYTFYLSEWKGTVDPKDETIIDFVTNNSMAISIVPIRDSDAEERKKLYGILVLLITFFLGFIGTLISRLVFANLSASKIIFPTLIHAILTACFFIPVIGWVFYVICTIYFMYKNYKLSMV